MDSLCPDIYFNIRNWFLYEEHSTFDWSIGLSALEMVIIPFKTIPLTPGGVSLYGALSPEGRLLKTRLCRLLSNCGLTTLYTNCIETTVMV
jgi:hypothetical protein